MVRSLSGVARNVGCLADRINALSAVTQAREGHRIMARVLAQIKVFPTEVTVDLSKLQDEIRNCLPVGATIVKIEEEPIAFGLVALVLTISMIEKGGLIEEVEKALASTANVGEIQTVAISRC